MSVIDPLSGALIGRAQATQTGAYAVRLPRPGTYEVRTLRIGYRPAQIPVVVGAGEVRVVDIVLEVAVATVAGIEVTARERCGLSKAESDTLMQFLSRARATLTALASPGERRDVKVHLTLINGTEEDDGRYAQVDSTRAREVITAPPFTTSAATFAHIGYIYRTADGELTFDAPGPQALLADEFLGSHCVSFTSPPRDHPDWIGLKFRPVSEVDSISDISGTFWLTRDSGEARRLDFSYTNVRDYRRRLCDQQGSCFTPLNSGHVGPCAVRSPIRQDSSKFARCRRNKSTS